MSTKLKSLLGFIEQAEMPQAQKRVLSLVAKRAVSYEDKRMEDRELVEKVAREKNLSEVVFSTDDVKIYKVYTLDEWDNKYPYRVIYLYEGKWHVINKVAQTFDVAFLIYLGHKHLGRNSQFATFAHKMLGI